MAELDKQAVLNLLLSQNCMAVLFAGFPKMTEDISIQLSPTPTSIRDVQHLGEGRQFRRAEMMSTVEQLWKDH
jgi:hypothetical protein